MRLVLVLLELDGLADLVTSPEDLDLDKAAVIGDPAARRRVAVAVRCEEEVPSLDPGDSVRRPFSVVGVPLVAHARLVESLDGNPCRACTRVSTPGHNVASIHEHLKEEVG